MIKVSAHRTLRTPRAPLLTRALRQSARAARVQTLAAPPCPPRLQVLHQHSALNVAYQAGISKDKDVRHAVAAMLIP